MRKTIIATCYFDNISPRIVELHRQVIERFAPENAHYHVIRTSSHPAAMYRFTNSLTRERDGHEFDKLIWLDIDCIPLCKEAFTLPFFHSDFWGAAQRANHIVNQQHIYAGPFAMGMRLKAYADMLFPTFAETHRGDVGEELTYAYEEKCGHLPVFLWPSHVEAEPAGGYWNLTLRQRFGLGTTYALDGKDLFYHAFQIRMGDSMKRFESKCLEVLK